MEAIKKMTQSNLHLIAGFVKDLHVGTLREQVIEKAKGLPLRSDGHKDGYQFDSERFDYFACHIGEEFVVGKFRSVRFKEGDEVTAVIKRVPSEDSVCVALLIKNRNQLHLQMMMNKGVWARFFQPVKLLCVLGLFGFIFIEIIFAFQSRSIREFFGMSAVVALISIFFVVSMSFWDYYFGSGKSEGDIASSIFKLLGFKNPNWLNLGRYSLLHRYGDSLGECVYEVGELLDDSQEPS